MKRNLYQELVLWKTLVTTRSTSSGQNTELTLLFSENLNPKQIIQNISLFFGHKIDAIGTLIFFDEIQISPSALTSLKYFQEQAPEFHIVAAGSLLGVSVGKNSRTLAIYSVSISQRKQKI